MVPARGNGSVGAKEDKMAGREFIIVCVERNKSRESIEKVGGVYTDDEQLRKMDVNLTLDLMRSKEVSFFTYDGRSDFAPVHGTCRDDDDFIETNPDDSLPDNLGFLPRCESDFATLLSNIEDKGHNIVSSFEAWKRAQSQR